MVVIRQKHGSNTVRANKTQIQDVYKIGYVQQPRSHEMLFIIMNLCKKRHNYETLLYYCEFMPEKTQLYIIWAVSMRICARRKYYYEFMPEKTQLWAVSMRIYAQKVFDKANSLAI